MAFMQGVIYGEDLFYKTIIQSNDKQLTLSTSFGKHLKRFDDYSALYSSTYTFHPSLSLFFSEYRVHEIIRVNPDLPRDSIGNNQSVANIFDDFVTVMRRRSAETGLKKKISDWESKIKKNKKRVFELEAKLFKRHARLAVIRLDLEHKALTLKQEDIEESFDQWQNEKLLDSERYWQGKEIISRQPVSG